MKIAVCCIAYNRLHSLKRLLNSLENAYYDSDVELIISIDKGKTNEVENFANEYEWKYGKKRVITHTENLGLRKHILSCGLLLSDYDALVVLEDDIVLSPNYYRYAVQCVEKYQTDDRIAGISLYNFIVNYQTRRPFCPMKSEYDVYFMNCAQSWGQVWMKESWFAFYNWYYANSDEFHLPHLPKALNQWPKSSWLKYHTRYCIEKDKYFVYPYCALSTNNSDIGTHNKVSNTLFQSTLSYWEQKYFNLPSFDKTVVKYDGFFEPKFLWNYLDVPIDDLCVDFNMSHTNVDKRYCLTPKILNHKIISSFGLSYKPWEINVMKHKEGNDLFLYDMQTNVHNPNYKSRIKEINYIYGNAASEIVKPQILLSYIYNKVVNKIKKYFK